MRLKHSWTAGVLAASWLAALCGSSCVPRQTTVELENRADGEVEAVVFYDNEQNIPESLIDNAGEVSFTIPPGETRSFSRDCDNLQAVKVEGDLRLIGGLGPSDNTGVFRDGDDFGCGDRLHFTFTSTTIPPSLNIDFETR